MDGALENCSPLYGDTWFMRVDDRKLTDLVREAVKNGYPQGDERRRAEAPHRRKYGEKWDASSVDVQNPMVAELFDRISRGQ